MSEINVVGRTQRIVVDPIISTVEVYDVQYAAESEAELLMGNRLAKSEPGTIDTGNLTSASPEITLWSFTLPASMVHGDHMRIRFMGSVGDLITGAAAVGWYVRVYLSTYKITELYPVWTPAAGYGSTLQRGVFSDDIDLMHQGVSSAWVWHRHSQGWMHPQTGAVATDGPYHTLAAYTNPAFNLTSAPVRIAVQPGSAAATNMRVRGLMVEHLIVPWVA